MAAGPSAGLGAHGGPGRRPGEGPGPPRCRGRAVAAPPGGAPGRRWALLPVALHGAAAAAPAGGSLTVAPAPLCPGGWEGVVSDRLRAAEPGCKVALADGLISGEDAACAYQGEGGAGRGLRAAPQGQLPPRTGMACTGACHRNSPAATPVPVWVLEGSPKLPAGFRVPWLPLAVGRGGRWQRSGLWGSGLRGPGRGHHDRSPAGLAVGAGLLRWQGWLRVGTPQSGGREACGHPLLPDFRQWGITACEGMLAVECDHHFVLQ